MRKTIITFSTEERKKLKKLLERKRISDEARKQIEALILHEAQEKTIMEIADEIARGTHKLMKWVKEFQAKRMDSLLVYSEDYSKVKNKGKTKITLINAPGEQELKRTEVLKRENKETPNPQIDNEEKDKSPKNEDVPLYCASCFLDHPLNIRGISDEDSN